ncbi:MAG: 16S rRNA (cytidine(1402)-2'-O)-methyltransferase [Verrucomicrobia bacterium TMED71]|nr:MAG: 16S rRNA (cytidine(1402)-2'-O)-methyltransferase [Verrucomicrobia bacterium TMED71]
MEGVNQSLTPEPGSLYVVATPIGNLADLTGRARSLLEKVSFVACEDTRVSGGMLSKLGIKNRLVSYHDKNERTMAISIADRLANGESVALISDAGTPAVSDPGFRLTRQCHVLSIPVIPVPGPCAATTILSASGLPSDGFLFVGFLPPKSAARKRFLESHIDFPYTIILYESCHRIEKLIAEMLEILGPDRFVCIGRELTKRFESITTGALAPVAETFKTSSKKGEFAVVIAPRKFVL